MTRRFDFCVLGGGPAGSAFAILMAQQGARVALIEKTAFELPRAGEHLPPHACGALRALGCTAKLFAQNVVSSPGILTRWSTPAPVFKRYVGEAAGPGLNLTRHRFDAALFTHAQRAGVETHTDAVLTHAERVSGGWELSFRADGLESLHAERVIDASGRASVFARRQGVTWQSFGDLVAAVGRLSTARAGVPDDCCLFVDACPEGWWSVTPTRGEIIATFYARAEAKRRVGLDEQHWWQWGLDAAPGVRARLERVAAELLDVRMHAAFPRVLDGMYGPDWLAIGDAAATHDPLSGHGVQYAFESAFRAAEIASSDMPLEQSGDLYQEAILSRFESHMRNRELVYREAPYPGLQQVGMLG